MFKQVSIIAFDLDDTLWPCMPVINRAEEILYQWLQRFYPRITESYNPRQMVELRKQFSAENERYAVDLTLLRYEFLAHVARQHDYDHEQVSQQGFDIFYDARQQVEFYADVLPCLERLRQQFRLGSISNGNASVERVGLGHLIEHAVSACDLKVAKPDPLIFQHLADRFEASPGQIVYVGDHPLFDVVAPLEAGYEAIWINREGIEWPDDLPGPEHQVGDLHELEALLMDR